jgi:hypothetical protein
MKPLAHRTELHKNAKSDSRRSSLLLGSVPPTYSNAVSRALAESRLVNPSRIVGGILNPQFWCHFHFAARPQHLDCFLGGNYADGKIGQIVLNLSELTRSATALTQVKEMAVTALITKSLRSFQSLRRPSVVTTVAALVLSHPAHLAANPRILARDGRH